MLNLKLSRNDKLATKFIKIEALSLAIEICVSQYITVS